jgi:hypothetical protein
VEKKLVTGVTGRDRPCMGTPFRASGEKVSVVVLEGGEWWEVVRSLRIICAGFCAVK